MIRGKPERALNTRVIYSEFTVPMYVHVCMYMQRYVHVLIAHAQYAGALHHHDQ